MRPPRAGCQQLTAGGRAGGCVGLCKKHAFTHRATALTRFDWRHLGLYWSRRWWLMAGGLGGLLRDPARPHTSGRGPLTSILAWWRAGSHAAHALCSTVTITTGCSVVGWPHAFPAVPSGLFSQALHSVAPPLRPTPPAPFSTPHARTIIIRCCIGDPVAPPASGLHVPHAGPP